MKQFVLIVITVVAVVVTVPRNQREASSFLIRSGLRLIELGLALTPHKSRPVQHDERAPDPSVEDAAASGVPYKRKVCGRV